MARISGVDLPKQKRVVIALTYIYGIGPKISADILAEAKIDEGTRVKELSEAEVVALRDIIRGYKTEGDLKRDVNQNIRRLVEIGSYKGNRHKRKLPVHGQRTHTNARTKRGKRIAVAGKKKVVK